MEPFTDFQELASTKRHQADVGTLGLVVITDPMALGIKPPTRAVVPQGADRCRRHHRIAQRRSERLAIMSDDDTIRAHLVELENARCRAMMEADLDRLHALLHPELTQVHTKGAGRWLRQLFTLGRLQSDYQPTAVGRQSRCLSKVLVCGAHLGAASAISGETARR
jgi:hypothetical protein